MDSEKLYVWQHGTVSSHDNSWIKNVEYELQKICKILLLSFSHAKLRLSWGFILHLVSSFILTRWFHCPSVFLPDLEEINFRSIVISIKLLASYCRIEGNMLVNFAVQIAIYVQAVCCLNVTISLLKPHSVLSVSPPYALCSFSSEFLTARKQKPLVFMSPHPHLFLNYQMTQLIPTLGVHVCPQFPPYLSFFLA